MELQQAGSMERSPSTGGEKGDIGDRWTHTSYFMILKAGLETKGGREGVATENKTSALISAHLPPKLLKNHEPGGRREDEP